MQETRHEGSELRFIISGPNGLLEYRATPAFAALVIYEPGCNGEQCDVDCDAENGDEITLAWQAADHDDNIIWRELARVAMQQELANIPQPPHEPSAAGRAFSARLRHVGEEMAREGQFKPAAVDAGVEAVIMRYVVEEGQPLNEAIVSAAADTYQAALARGCNKAQADRLGMYVASVGAILADDVRNR